MTEQEQLKAEHEAMKNTCYSCANFVHLMGEMGRCSLVYGCPFRNRGGIRDIFDTKCDKHKLRNGY